MTGPLGNGTMPLWDLAGKSLRTPAYKLLGGAGQEKVPVYDGSIYFADLLPQYADRWQDRFKEEIDMGLADRSRGVQDQDRPRQQMDAAGRRATTAMSRSSS